MQSIVTKLRRQASYCAALGSRLTATLLEEIAEDYQRGGSCRDLFAFTNATSPAGSMLGFRIAGALHFLVLTGRTPDLAAFYPTVGGTFSETGFWPEALAALLSQRDTLSDYIENPAQTNEVGRAGTLLAGFLVIARETGLPLRCLEAGASAGLLLNWDRYRYDLGNSTWGEPASGVRINNRWTNPPGTLPPHSDVAVVERRGCDLNPIDVGDADARMRLRSFIWGDHPARLARIDAAMALACVDPATIDRCDAAHWIKHQLARPKPGVATVLYTSFSALYFDEKTRADIHETLRQAAVAATSEAPLALMRLEGNGPNRPPRLELYQWPSGRHRVVATSDILGLSTHWLKRAGNAQFGERG